MNIDKIFQAVRLKNYQEFLDLIDGKDINIINSDGQTLLHEAAAYNSVECANELIYRKASLNDQDLKGKTALHYAAANNSILVCDALIQGGADISISDDFGNQPLWTAVFNARGNYELVRLFLNNGANPAHKNKNRKSPLDFSIQIKDLQLMEVLQS